MSPWSTKLHILLSRGPRPWKIWLAWLCYHCLEKLMSWGCSQGRRPGKIEVHVKIALMSSLYLCDLAEVFYKGNGSRSEYMVETFLSYWISWYFFLSAPDDWLNPSIHWLYILIPKESVVRIGSALFRLAVLTVWLVHGEHNASTREIWHSDVCRLVLPMFFLERFPSIAPKLMESPTLVIEEMILVDASRGIRPCNTYKTQAWRWVNIKQPAKRSLVKMTYKKEGVLCFRPYSYTPWSITTPTCWARQWGTGLSLARRALKEIWHYWLLWFRLAPMQAQIQGVCLNLQSLKGVAPTGIRLGTVWMSGDVSYSNALVTEYKFVGKGSMEIFAGAERLFFLHQYGTKEGRGELYDWSL